MARQRLLERLQLLQTPPDEHSDDAALQVQSILDHVKHLLSTHKGTVPISDDYGMPDVFFSQGINFKESSHRMKQAIVAVINRYEPRLKRVTIESLSTRNDLLKQQFRASGVLSSNPSKKIDFTIEISSEARIKLTAGNEQD